MMDAVAHFWGQRAVGSSGEREVDEGKIAEGTFLGEDGIEFAGIGNPILGGDHGDGIGQFNIGIAAGDDSWAFGGPGVAIWWWDAEDSGFSGGSEGCRAGEVGDDPFSQHSYSISVLTPGEVYSDPEADVDFAEAEDQDIIGGEV